MALQWYLQRNQADTAWDIIASDVTPVAVGQSAVIGTSSFSARADHAHAVSFATIQTILGTASSAISVNSQKITNLSDPQAAQDAATQNYVQAQVAALLTSSAPANVTKSSAAVGSSVYAALSDHKHDISTAVASDLSTSTSASAEGSATSMARSDHGHKVTISSSSATATSNATTTSTSDVLMTSMTISAPYSGDYMVQFSGSASNNTDAENVFASIYVNSVQVAASVRGCNVNASGIGVSAVAVFPLSTHALVTGVTAGQAIEVKWHVDSGTGTVNQRTLTLMKVN